MRHPLLMGLMLTVLSGCPLANLTPQARFAESSHTLNDASRWGRVDIASEQVSPKYRPRFASRHRDWGTAVTIADSDIVRMQIAEDRKSATSEVTVSWYRSDGITVRTSVIAQTWEAEHGHFMLVDEAVRVGDPGVFVEETEAPAEGSAVDG